MADDRQWNVNQFMNKRVTEEGIPPESFVHDTLEPADVESNKTQDAEDGGVQGADEIREICEPAKQEPNPSVQDSLLDTFAAAFSCIIPRNVFIDEQQNPSETKDDQMAPIKLEEMETVLNPTMTMDDATDYQQTDPEGGVKNDEGVPAMVKSAEAAQFALTQEQEKGQSTEDAVKESFVVIDPWFDSKKKDEIDEAAAAKDQRDRGETYFKQGIARCLERNIWLVLVLVLICMAIVLGVVLSNRDESDESIVDAPEAATNNLTATPTMFPTPAPPTMSPTFGDPALELSFNFDDFPNEVGWELIDLVTGEAVFIVPIFTYLAGVRTFNHQIPVEFGREYTLNIVDEGQDGLCCSEPGSYTATFRGRELASGGGDYGLEVSHTFVIPIIV